MTTESNVQPSGNDENNAVATSTIIDTAAAKKPSDHPSYERMIIAAITNLKERKGSSRPAIKKYVLANYNVNPGSQFDYQLSNAIRRGVGKNIFSLPKGSSGSIKLVKPTKQETKRKPIATNLKKKDFIKKKAAKMVGATKTTTKIAIKTSNVAEVIIKKKVGVSPARKTLKKRMAAVSKTPTKKLSSNTSACKQ